MRLNSFEEKIAFEIIKKKLGDLESPDSKMVFGKEIKCLIETGW